MNDKNAIRDAVTAAIIDINQTLPSDRQISTTPEAALYGPQGMMDSLTLTLLIVAVEQKIEQNFSQSITLLDYSLGLGENHVFSSIDALGEHIYSLLNSNTHA